MKNIATVKIEIPMSAVWLPKNRLIGLSGKNVHTKRAIILYLGSQFQQRRLFVRSYISPSILQTIGQ
jgi:hypothetical protein